MTMAGKCFTIAQLTATILINCALRSVGRFVYNDWLVNVFKRRAIIALASSLKVSLFFYCFCKFSGMKPVSPINLATTLPDGLISM